MSRCSSDSARPAAAWVRLIACVALSSVSIGCGSDDDPPGPNPADAGSDRSIDTGGGMDTSGEGGGSDAAPGPLTTYKVCTDDNRLGAFWVELTDTYTGIVGGVFDVVNSVRQGVEFRSFGACRLMKRPDPIRPCNPVCTEAQDCKGTGPSPAASICVPKPQTVSVGEVKMTGLLQPMTLVFQAGSYINPPVQPAIHPLFAPGANIQLNAAGQGAYSPFTLKGYGVEVLQIPTAKLRVERGMPVTLTWTPAANPGPAKVTINFSVNRHAVTDSWFECLVDDTGSYTIAAALTDELFKLGTSGFPSVDLVRVAGDTATVNGGCVEMQVFSKASRELDVPGINSCKEDGDCTAPQVCTSTLTCGTRM